MLKLHPLFYVNHPFIFSSHACFLASQSILTLAMSYMVGVISSFYDTDIVMMAIGITVLVCFTVIVFSLQVSARLSVLITPLFHDCDQDPFLSNKHCNRNICPVLFQYHLLQFSCIILNSILFRYFLFFAQFF